MVLLFLVLLMVLMVMMVLVVMVMVLASVVVFVLCTYDTVYTWEGVFMLVSKGTIEGIVSEYGCTE